MARIIPAFTVRCQTNETGLTADKIRLLFRYCVQTKNHSTALKAPLPVNPPVCDQADSGGGRTRTSGVSLSQSYSLLPSPLGHATGASLLPVTVRCVPCPIHLYPQAHGRWIGIVELPGIEPGSGLPPAIACRHVRIRRLTLIRGRVRSANPHGL